ncbi:hypothetical protein NliqN6_0137 [Naganishia liquefaciens]|uniref:serine--tRNA ligase n=1 Tax=Naganishia liquefaciens TaxID=104408 RepID=A0A8H3TMD1_9TREE|nr:hypothetical protein NliqN6_0137 [Naganishia liquefaciens]
MPKPRSVRPLLHHPRIQRHLARPASQSAWDPRSLPQAPPKPATPAQDPARRPSKPPAPITAPVSSLPRPRYDYRSIIADADAKTLNAILRRAPVHRDTIFHLTRLHETSLTLRRKIDSVKHKQRDLGFAIRAGGGEEAVEQAKKLKKKVGEYEKVLEETERELEDVAGCLPNDTWSGTPVGSEAHAVEIERLGRDISGEEEAAGTVAERDHWDIAQYWNMVDGAASALSTGTSWAYLKGPLALLEQALIQYALCVAVSRGWTPVSVPDVVKEDIMSRCGFNPRDTSQVGQTYYVSTTPPGVDPPSGGSSSNLVMAATAEIPLAALVANKIHAASSLPIKNVGISHSFRAEAGARGADTRGLYRLHQFTKVELFAVTANDPASDASGAMMSEILEVQKEVVRGLGLSVRVLEMPTEELGASAFRKIDMEAWMPGRGKWGEISSTSDCKDYQSRRLHIRHRPLASSPDGGIPFAHTLNGTCAAIPRLLVALLENGVVLGPEGQPVGVQLPAALERFWVSGQEWGQGERKGWLEWV